MNNKPNSILFWICVGTGLGLSAAHWIPGFNTSRMKTTYKACITSLPRDKICELIITTRPKKKQ